MSDINESSGIPEQDQYDNTTGLNNGQYTASEDGSTYWESNEIQSSFDAQSQQPESNDNDHNQRVQDYSYNEFKSNQYKLQKKKKRFIPIITALVVLALLLATAASAYAFSDTFRNSIDLLIKSPRDYYSSIENRSIGNAVDKSMAINKMSKINDNAVETTLDISYDKDTAGAMLEGFLGMSLTDLEEYIGIPLDSIGFNVISASEEDNIYQNIGLNLNSIDIFTGEIFMDNASSEMLLFLPDLSPAYLRQSLDISEYGVEDFDIGEYSEITKKITSDSTGEFIKRYAKLITDEVEDVVLTKKVPLAVGDLSVDTNLLTVTFYPNTLKNILSKVIEETKSDEYILDLLPLMDMTKEEFIDKADMSLEEMKSNLDKLPQNKEILIMKLYVGNDGSILGRSLEIINNMDETVNISFSNIEKDNKAAYEFFISENDKDNMFHIKGNHTIANKAYTGKATLMMTPEYGEAIEFELEYENFKHELRNNRTFFYGNLNLYSHTLMGIELALELDVDDDVQLATFKLNMGRASLVTFDASIKYLEDFTAPKPDEDTEVYDLLTEIDQYAATMNIEEYLSDLSDKLGIDIQGLLGFYLPIY